MVMKILYLIFILFMLGAALISFWIFYTWITDQTDWVFIIIINKILSYIIAYAVDTLLLDAVALIANKYLGEEAKKSLRK